MPFICRVPLVLGVVVLLGLASSWRTPTFAQGTTNSHRSYAEWKQACQKLPANRLMRGRIPSKDVLPLKEFRELGAVVDDFLWWARTGTMSQSNRWVGGSPGAPFFNTQTAYFLKRDRTAPGPIPFEPFAQKVIVPPDSEVFVHADLHGDVRSLMVDLNWLNEKGYLNGFEIARPNMYMIFLGDYTDRGSYGAEVLYTLFRLKIANPDRVFMARGNHEELSLQVNYGFMEEARMKFGQALDAQKILRAYDFLPVAIYLGCNGNFVQCQHGGMEPGYNPGTLLQSEPGMAFQTIGTLKQKTFYKENPKWSAEWDAKSKELAEQAYNDFKPLDPIHPSVLGFMWNDFTVFASEPDFAIDPGRAFVYGQRAVQYMLKAGSSGTNQLRAIFRGHQQSSQPNPMMRRLVAGKGIFRHWQSTDDSALKNASVDELVKKIERGAARSVPAGSVWTFNVSPDSVYGEGCGFTFDTFGLLTMADDFQKWQLRAVNLEVP